MRFLPFVAALVAVACASPIPQSTPAIDSSSTISPMSEKSDLTTTPLDRAWEDTTTTPLDRAWEETTTTPFAKDSRIEETSSFSSSSVTPAAPVRRVRQIAETSSTTIASSSELTTPLKDRALEETTTTPLDRAWEETTTTPFERALEQSTTPFAKDSRIEETSSISSSSVSPAAPVRKIRGIEEAHLGETTTAKMDDMSTTELFNTPLSERALEETTTFSDRAIEESTTAFASSTELRLNEESTSASTPSTTLSTILSRRARAAVQGEDKLAESTTAKLDEMSTTAFDRAWEESTTTIATSTELRWEGTAETTMAAKMDDMSTTLINDRALEESTTPIASSTELRWEGKDSTIEAETTSAMNDISSSTTFA